MTHPPPSNTARSQSRPRRRRYSAIRAQHGIVVFLCLCVISCTLTSIWDESQLGEFSSEDGRRQLAFLDAKPVPTHPYGRITIDQNYQSLLEPSAIDSSLFRKKRKKKQGDGKDPDKGFADGDSACDNVLLFLPHSFAHNGQASQLNNYLLAAMIATFTDRAMVILEATPSLNEFSSNSQFGCPPEAWETVMVRTGGTPKRVGWKEDFPNGLSRLIKHPAWLSRQCPVPCQETHAYEDWEKASKAPLETQCTNSRDGRQSNVIAMGGQQIRDYFEFHYKDLMLDRTASIETARTNYDWSTRLGAAPHEARIFSGLRDRQEIWDYVSAFLARSGTLRFHPWIARDVEEYVARKSDLPLDAPYDAIHVRRGDMLETDDGKKFVEQHWLKARNGTGTEGTERLSSRLRSIWDQKPFQKDYIPFTQYLSQFENVKCNDDGRPRIVYVATDDPKEIQSEISDLPKDSEGNTLLAKDACHKFHFIFSPFEQSRGFHIGTDSMKDDCEERYSRNVAGIADLMILAKSHVLVSEYNSNWGRLLRIFRMRMRNDDSLVEGSRPVMLKEMKVAWGHQHPGAPGW